MQLQTPTKEANRQIFWALLSLVIVLFVIAGYLVISGAGADDEISFDPFKQSDFVRIEAGSFLMGSSDSDAYPDEQPVHSVTITKPYLLAKTEVTQAQWMAVMSHNPSLFPNPDHPVDNVDWGDIQKFLNRINKLANCDDCYRLPTEAEWEYAARAGSSSRHPFGNTADSLGKYAWYSANSGATTHPVARKAPNAWGLYDMQGNVYEWVQDFYGTYSTNEVIDPIGATVGTEYILRGGSWTDEAREQRPTYRDYYAPNHRHNFFGFRVVRTKRF